MPNKIAKATMTPYDLNENSPIVNKIGFNYDAPLLDYGANGHFASETP